MADPTKTCFFLLDHDGDGALTSGEAMMLCRLMGGQIPDEDLEKIIGQKQFFTLEEFEKSFKSYLKGGQNAMTAAFKTFDHDRVGKVSMHEMKSLIQNLGDRLSAAEVEEVLLQANPDGEGAFDFAAFIKANYPA